MSIACLVCNDLTMAIMPGIIQQHTVAIIASIRQSDGGSAIGCRTICGPTGATLTTLTAGWTAVCTNAG